MTHLPVLIEEVIKYLDPKPNQNFVDCTLGDGGHANAILKLTAPNGKLLGIDVDPEAIAKMEESNKRLTLVNDNFRNLSGIVSEFGFVHGILIDLGFSSSTLERGRGFSFEKDELLDMRFNPEKGIRVAEIINGWNQSQIARLLEEYGEEKLSFQIANKIVQNRRKEPIVTTKQLADTVCEVYREKLKSKKEVPWIGGTHPATKTFQALRIEVNEELSAIEEVLPQAINALEIGGRLAVIAFHSLEDRIVKHYFKSIENIKILTKKPVCAGKEELKKNPRARSAKLRVVEKIYA